MNGPDAATVAQTRAADPSVSTWLSANAGSGKTRVLIQRVVRLLFSGTPPQRILCLTFTKAAAAEMQNRLFRLLGSWAMLEESALRKALREAGIEGAIGRSELLAARRLFAQAIEAPGGLRILTIHSFCSSLLRRFPLEARVSPAFTEIDETTTNMLRTEVLEQMADDHSRGLIDEFASAYRSDDWSDLVADICKNRLLFQTDRDRAAIRAALLVPADLEIEHLVADVLSEDGIPILSALQPIIAVGTTTEVGVARTLQRFDAGDIGHFGLSVLEKAFVKKDGTSKAGTFPTVATRKTKAAHLVGALDAFMERVAAARPLRLALHAADRTEILHRFAREFLHRYDAAKAERGWLDFDDLILRAAAVLSDHAVAQWILYRLDGGIDHILVDEAQDTGPEQWQVIERLADEFAYSPGSRGEERTVFVVGDKKQSIYSFQGADLQTFDRMEGYFRERYLPRSLWQAVSLEYSFRSSPAILQVVDATFDGRVNAGLGGAPEHFAFFEDMPGRVDVWPPILDTENRVERDYFTPTFMPAPEKSQNRLARLIAAQIKQMISEGTPVKDRGAGYRAAHEGDFLILVQRRSPLFAAIIRECKAANLEVAGADRLKLAAEIAVNDLVALLKFLSLPEDDLSLAAALRSPIFGWTEQQLFHLAAHRAQGSYLWAALRDASITHQQTLSVLDDLRTHAEFLRPFDLLERALTEHGMRKLLLERLGREAEDGIDELLTQALTYEQGDVPTLTGFLIRLEAEQGDIKRQTQQGARAIRVMTVHGAKGLEAPIVILPDTIGPSQPRTNHVLQGQNGVALWRTNKDVSPDAITALRDEAADREAQERMRLLYVAMTRAESWLIVATAGAPRDQDPNWYALARDGAARAGAGTVEIDGIGAVLRHSFGSWPALPAMDATSAPSDDTPLPLWLKEKAPTFPAPPPPLSPSALPGAKALAGEGGQDPDLAMRYGTLLHLLLQHLPEHLPDERRQIAFDLLQSPGLQVTAAEMEGIVADATRVMDSPSLRNIFALPYLAEVEIAGSVDTFPGRRIHGTIDRLMVLPDRIVAVDFKSNAVVPQRPADVPEGILRQMAVYSALLSDIYPGRSIEMAIVWTSNASYMPLPFDILRSAMTSTPIP